MPFTTSFLAKKGRKLILQFLLLLVGVVWAGALWPASSYLRVSFLDVGQGDATLLRTPEDNTILVDGGPSYDLDAALGRELPFWQRDIDLLVVSHFDEDHIFGLTSVLEKYHVLYALVPGVACASKACEDLFNLFDQKGVDILVGEPGREVIFSNSSLKILWPPAGCYQGSNDCSLVGVFSYGVFDVFLSGDLEVAGQRALLQKYPVLPVEVLKVPHHGADCLSDDFLSFLKPQVSVISVGDNRYGHPAPSTIDRLTKVKSLVLRTDISGTIGVVSDGQTWWLR